MITLTRRHVIASFTGTAVSLCPAILNAQSIPEPDWGDIPTTAPVGQTSLVDLPAGPASLDVSTLQAGEVAVVGRPNSSDAYSATGNVQYVAIMRRTDEQIAFGQANDPAGAVQDPRYFVVELVCTHRGKAIGLTGNPAAPFACTDRGSRHSSFFDASGLHVAGAGDTRHLPVPQYTLAMDGDQVVVNLA